MWKWVHRFKPQTFYSRYTLKKNWVGPTAGTGATKKINTSCPLPRIEPWFLTRPARSLVVIPRSYPAPSRENSILDIKCIWLSAVVLVRKTFRSTKYAAEVPVASRKACEVFQQGVTLQSPWEALNNHRWPKAVSGNRSPFSQNPILSANKLFIASPHGTCLYNWNDENFRLHRQYRKLTGDCRVACEFPVKTQN